MRLLIVLTCGLLSSLSWAKPASKFGVHVDALKFEEFIKLSEADREDYLEAMRQFALKAEREQSVARMDDATKSALWAMISIGEAFAAAGDDCIYAGYMSTIGAHGRCQAPASRSWNYGGQSKSYCSGGTLCNPMIYGFGADGSGICTSNRSSPTVDCDTKYRKIPNYGGAQIAKQLSDSGLGKDFDAQGDKLAKYCASSNSSSQASLCKYAQERSSYLKKKIAAAEKAKKPAEVKPKPQVNAEAVPPKEPPKKPETTTLPPANSEAAPPRPPAPIPGGTTAGAAGAPAGQTGSGTTAAPVGVGTQEAPPRPPAKIPEAKPPEVKKPEVSKDGCIHNKTDFEAMRDKFKTPALRDLDKNPSKTALFATASGAIVTGAIKVRLVGEEVVISSHIWPPKIPFMSDGKLIVNESKVDNICFKPGNWMVIKFKDGDTKFGKMTDQGIEMAKEMNGQTQLFGTATSSQYETQRKAVLDERKNRGGQN